MGRFALWLAAFVLLTACKDSEPVSTHVSPAGDAGACAADQDCSLCCNMAHATENEIAVGYVLSECACKMGETPCAASCKASGNDICAEPDIAPIEACIDCIEGQLKNESSACVATAITTCAADEACTPLVHCLRGCP